jgi:8-oxo-dGTP diphosphatase
MSSAPAPRIVVTAAVIERDGRYLVTRRLSGTHLAGFWEFPGGKCDTGEPLAACLEREIAEELDTTVRIGAEVHHVAHEYPERIVELHFFRCELLGEPRPALGQEMRWVARGELAMLEFPPADAELVAMLAHETPGPEPRTTRTTETPN